VEAIVAFLSLLALIVKVLFGLIVICIGAFVLIMCACLWGAVFAACNQVRQLQREHAGTSDG
jgi:hypothetical protein